MTHCAFSMCVALYNVWNETSFMQTLIVRWQNCPTHLGAYSKKTCDHIFDDKLKQNYPFTQIFWHTYYQEYRPSTGIFSFPPHLFRVPTFRPVARLPSVGGCVSERRRREDRGAEGDGCGRGVSLPLGEGAVNKTRCVLGSGYVSGIMPMSIRSCIGAHLSIGLCPLVYITVVIIMPLLTERKPRYG